MAARRRQADRRNWPKNLYITAKGSYWFRNPDTKKTYGLGTDFKVAAAQARAANAEIERRKGEVGLLQRINGGDTTVLAWCDTFEKILSSRGTKSRHTLAGIRADVNHIRRAEFSAQALARVTPKEVGEYIRKIEATISAGRAASLRARLLDMFNEAIGAGLLDAGKNPVVAIKKPQAEEVSRQRLTLDDFMAIYREAKKDRKTPWAANAFMLALLTGQRREDLRDMLFEHVKDGFLWVEQHKSQGKTKLKIPTSVGLAAVGLTIADVIRDCRDSVVSKSIIHHSKVVGAAKPGGKPSLTSFSGSFARNRDSAEIATADGNTPPTFHEIRSLAARLYSEQYGPEFAQALLGHKSAEMTALYRDNRGREWTELVVAAR